MYLCILVVLVQVLLAVMASTATKRRLSVSGRYAPDWIGEHAEPATKADATDITFTVAAQQKMVELHAQQLSQLEHMTKQEFTREWQQFMSNQEHRDILGAGHITHVHDTLPMKVQLTSCQSSKT